jgi:hypothetical protein
MWNMSETYNNILIVQDIHGYNNGNIHVSGTVLWVIHKHKKFINGAKEVCN